MRNTALSVQGLEGPRIEQRGSVPVAEGAAQGSRGSWALKTGWEPLLGVGVGGRQRHFR